MSAFARILVLAGLLVALGSRTDAPAVATQSGRFNSNTTILIPTDCTFCQPGPAKPYPSSIEASGFPSDSVIRNVWITLEKFIHQHPDDIDILLVGPDGMGAVIMSDVGGSENVSGKDLVLSLDSTDYVPDDAAWNELVTYAPTNRGAADTFPDATYSPLFHPILFKGRPANGTWSLYIFDDENDVQQGYLNGGWTLDIQVDEAPVIGLPSAPPTYVENAAPVALDSGATVLDGDTAHYNGGDLAVAWSNATAEDSLTIPNQGSGPGLIGVAGKQVFYEGTKIGVFDGGDSKPLTVSFQSTAATPAAVQALIRNLLFEVASEAPSTATRSFTLTLSTAANWGGKAVATKDVKVQSVADAPLLSAIANVSFDEDTGPVMVPLTVSDVDSAPGAIKVSATSSNQRLLPNASLTFAGLDQTLRLAPPANANGRAVVSVTASDGVASSTRRFAVVVGAVPDPTLLRVAKRGSGGGIIVSVPDGVACGSDCSESYEVNTRVRLTAEPRRHSLFAGWEGPCRGRGDCVVRLARATTVRATFVRPTCLGLPATLAGAGMLTGTRRDDVIAGTSRPNRIEGRGGNDRICSGGGNDVVSGGPGNDTVQAGAGRDVVDGGAGRDVLRGGGGDDRTIGASGGDRLFGQAGADTLNGGSGTPDRCDGGGGTDTLAPGHGCEAVAGVP